MPRSVLLEYAERMLALYVALLCLLCKTLPDPDPGLLAALLMDLS
jgi:hypothetical protein